MGAMIIMQFSKSLRRFFRLENEPIDYDPAFLEGINSSQRLLNLFGKQSIPEPEPDISPEGRLYECNASGVELCAVYDVSLNEAMGSALISPNMIQGVLIARSRSKNNRLYTSSALDDIAKHSEGIAVYLNHARQGEDVRRIEDYAGILRNVKRRGDCVQGDLEPSGCQEASARLWAIARQKPRGFGLSLSTSWDSVDAKRGIGGSPDTILRIKALDSVDLVSASGMAENLFS